MNPNACEESIKALSDLLHQYHAQEKCGMQSVLRDVLTDLRHAAHERHLDIDKAIEGSRMVWESEMGRWFVPGMEVMVDSPPNEKACWNNEFRGTIVKVSQERKMYDAGRNEYSCYCTVKDQEDNHYDIDYKYVHPMEKED